MQTTADSKQKLSFYNTFQLEISRGKSADMYCDEKQVYLLRPSGRILH